MAYTKEEREQIKSRIIDLSVNPSIGECKLSNKECIFCKIKHYILENELSYAIYDKYPVSKGHMLFIPKTSCKRLF